MKSVDDYFIPVSGLWMSQSYRSARDGHFYLPPMRTHELLEVFTHGPQYPQSIILSQCVEEVLDYPALVSAAGVLF